MRFPTALLAAVTALKALDVAARWSPGVAVLWASAAMMLLLRPRLGAAVVTLLAGWAIAGPLYGHHTTLLALFAAAVVVFPNPNQLRFVVRHQLSVLYGFAALAKANADWLSGGVIQAFELPAWPSAAFAAWTVLGIEATLAAAVWAPALRRWWLPLAVAMHVAFVFGVDDPAWAVSGIVSFGTLAVGMLWWSTDGRASPMPTAVADPAS